MDNIGFIGLGHMGTALLENMLDSGCLDSYSVFIYNRTYDKSIVIKEKYPRVTVIESLNDMFNKVDTIISSVTSMAQKPILESLQAKHIHFISVSNGLTIREMSKVYSGRISRIMPTVTLGGYTLITDDAKDLEPLFSKISTPLFIRESDFDSFTLISSCGPGLFASLLQVLLDRFSNVTDFDKNILSDMINRTFSGTLETLINKPQNYGELINQVATKGGLTEVGVNIIRDEFPEVVDSLLTKSLEYNRKVTSEIVY